ncbi:MAG TPA: phosphatidate cytidylyltransferase [Bdellovibrionales bacterium]|nr:phosphatidate cytidylyltransferase [Bdellovibrionales bacterium]
MADTSSTFFKRVASGLLAAAILLSLIYFQGRNGVLTACVIATVLGIREFSRMVFTQWNMPALLPPFYALICLCHFALIFMYPAHADALFAGACITFLVSAIWITRGKVSNENLWAAIAIGTFGLVYTVLFPSYAVAAARLEDGEKWVLLLLLVVFFGDIFAYFGGRWFGKHKFMPMISPNKTWEGSLAGLFGSVAAGTVHVTGFSDVAVWKTMLFCLVCGAVAQSGDLLISLLKRVAKVKDTGTIMPGHGGVLDRLDGVFISCPLVYAFALYVTQG